MLLEKYKTLTSEFPAEADTVSRLRELVEGSSGKTEFTMNRLIDRLKPTSTYYLFHLLVAAERDGIIKKQIKVNSPLDGGIQKFNSVIEIPDLIYDHHQGFDIPVTCDLLSTVYSPVA